MNSNLGLSPQIFILYEYLFESQEGIFICQIIYQSLFFLSSRKMAFHAGKRRVMGFFLTHHLLIVPSEEQRAYALL